MRKVIYCALFIIVSVQSYCIPLISLENTKWKIVELADFPDIIGTSKDQAMTYIQTIIEYKGNFMYFNGKKYMIKKTRVELWNSNDLFMETTGTGSSGLTFEIIKFYEKEITVIINKIIDNPGPGSFLLITSNNRILTLWNGNFYWMEKVN